MLLAIIFTTPVFADTDGTELKITAQPDRFFLELGPDWAGTQFELKLDTGVFPVPVVTNESGILSIDLGGSKTYTLRLISTPGSEVGQPLPQPSQESEIQEKPDAGKLDNTNASSDKSLPTAKAHNQGIPALHLILFVVGSLAAIGAVIIIGIFKKRREKYDYDYDEEE